MRARRVQERGASARRCERRETGGNAGVARLDYDRIHDEAIVIDAVCPLMMRRQYIDWWIEGGAS